MKKNTLQKTLALVLAGAMTMGLAACGGGSDKASETTPAEAETPVEETEDAAEGTEADAGTEAEAETEAPASDALPEWTAGRRLLKTLL